MATDSSGGPLPARPRRPKRLSLLRVLGPMHVWALGVGIVLVGRVHGLELHRRPRAACSALSWPAGSPASSTPAWP